MATQDPSPAHITQPALLFSINQLYREGMTDDEIYAVTRGNWVLAEKRTKALYAFAVASGIIVGVYTIDPTSWVENSERNAEQVNERRWQFTGRRAPHMQHLIGQSVAHYRKKGETNPVKYINIKEQKP